MKQTHEHRIDLLVTRDGELDYEYLENSQRQQRREALKGFLGHTSLIILKAPVIAAVALYNCMEADMDSQRTMGAGD